MARIAKAWVPMAWEAFTDYRLQAALFSRAELAAIQASLRGEKPDLNKLGLSPREQREFRSKLGLAEEEVGEGRDATKKSA
jgi:thymidylate synthase (FAD)